MGSEKVSLRSTATNPNMAVQLPHTLQTCVGMVLDNGAPYRRTVPSEVARVARLERVKMAVALPHLDSIPLSDNYTAPESVVQGAISYITEFGGPVFERPNIYTSSHVKNYAANLSACVTDVSKEDLKRHIQERTRVDLEQAAAIVMSAFMKCGRVHDATRLVKELGLVMATSCMWLEEGIPLSSQRTVFASPEKLAGRLQSSAARIGINIPQATNYRELVPLLMRVRRCKPDNRCLDIPEWMFREAGIEPPAHFKEFFAQQDGTQNPTAPREADSIILSRRHFRADQRNIYHLFKFWKPDIKLRKGIRRLEEKVLYNGSWIQERVFDVDDVVLLCHYFFHFQRRLQRKVVSDLAGYFLKKGESRKLFQNNLSIMSTFENVLLEIAESNEEGVIVAMGDDDTLDLIDQTCLFMKEYVDVHGGGSTQNLTFKKNQVGGSGRGPVDEYNTLCDVLAYLREQAKGEGIEDMPNPSRKFLAKDIMDCNNSWKDDAFAGDEKPNWEIWLQKRGLFQDGGWDLMMD